MDLKITIFRLTNIDLDAKLLLAKHQPLRIIKMGHISEASVGHPYQKKKKKKKKKKAGK